MSVSIVLEKKKKTATCFGLESNGLMKKKSCSALPCSVPCSPEPSTSGVSPLGDVCTLQLWLRYFFVFQSGHLKWLSLPVVSTVDFCGVSRPVWECLGVQLSQTRHFPEMQ